jgi:ubiquinone/menaquinone biosynthesis C-methylase UbiE
MSEKIGKARDIRKPEAIKVMGGIEDSDIESNEARFNTFKYVLNEAGMPLSAETKILEVGTGSGEFLAHLRSKGLNAVGMDFRPRGKTDGVAAARIENLPFSGNTFDVIASTAIFDKGFYYQNQKQMITDIARVLKENGVYIARGEDIKVPSKLLRRIAKYDGEVPIALYRKVNQEP